MSYWLPTVLFSAFLTGIAQQPFYMGWLSWASIVPFIFVLTRLESLKDFIKVGFIWGTTYNLTVIFWLAINIGTTPLIGLISMLVAVLYQSVAAMVSGSVADLVAGLVADSVAE